MTTPLFRDGAPCWADLGAPSLDEAHAFYEAVAGWSITTGHPDFGGYATAMVGDKAVAAIGPLMGGAPPSWTLYFASADAEATEAATASIRARIRAFVRSIRCDLLICPLSSCPGMSHASPVV